MAPRLLFPLPFLFPFLDHVYSLLFFFLIIDLLGVLDETPKGKGRVYGFYR